MQVYELCSDMIDVVIDVSCIYGCDNYPHSELVLCFAYCFPSPRLKGRTDSLAYDSDSASVIKLSNSYVLYLREVDK